MLAALLRVDPGRPLVTFYDDATGERIELSVTTYANWVAKTASLLVEERDLERGDRLLVDLPTHWLGPVFLGAAWTAGLVVSVWDGDRRRRVVCGPEGARGAGPGRAAEVPVVATAAAAARRCGSPTRCRPASTTSGSRSGRSPTRSWPWDPPGRRRPGRARALTQDAAVADGRRREPPSPTAAGC